jgi:porphobilinogen synthase
MARRPRTPQATGLISKRGGGILPAETMASFPTTRLRRLRRTEALRRLARETHLASDQLILPLFCAPGRGVRDAIGSMPGVFRRSPDNCAAEAHQAHQAGLGGVILFGVPEKKDDRGSSAVDPDGIVPVTIKAIKERAPDLVVIADVCLCDYTDHGHCGLLKEGAKGEVDNDATLPRLAEQALVYARAGADIVAPSDMMDGRVGAIRRGLDEGGLADVPILSYAAKYASAFYQPFRDAAQSAPKQGDRRGYQMDPGNVREALREVELDLAEGADLVMVKPALSYLDVIQRVRERFDVPLLAYNVSGEYAMIRAAAAHGWLDERRAMMEVLLSIRRAGADAIITYFALDAAKILDAS